MNKVILFVGMCVCCNFDAAHAKRYNDLRRFYNDYTQRNASINVTNHNVNLGNHNVNWINAINNNFFGLQLLLQMREDDLLMDLPPFAVGATNNNRIVNNNHIFNYNARNFMNYDFDNRDFRER